ncbi:glycosyltransferase family 4 protein [Nitriliruptoraceae bacterium ZYF776]|nr:glycosyltransferase family 4 protein [Profundirhabdus halotolerans]
MPTCWCSAGSSSRDRATPRWSGPPCSTRRCRSCCCTRPGSRSRRAVRPGHVPPLDPGGSRWRRHPRGEGSEEVAVVRILQIAPPWFTVPPTGYGGTEQVVALLTDGLVEAGHEVTLVAAGGSVSRAELWTTGAEPPTTSLGDAVVELAHLLRGHRARARFDLVHDHTVLGAALAGVEAGPPVVHTLHGPWTPDHAALYRQVADRVHLVAISADQARRAPADVPLAGVVHNAIDVERHPLVRAKGDHLAYVGRACAEKGPDVAIEVARRVGRPLRMAVKVNEASEQRYAVEVLRPAMAANPDVELVEVRSHADKVALLGGAAAVLFPIRWPEPFGLVPLEANACGTPVVAFACGAVPEVVDDGRTAILVPPDDVAAMCDAVERAVLLDPDACRAHARARFDVPNLVRGYTAVYERVLAGVGPAAAATSAGR